MASFAIEFEKHELVPRYIDQTKERLKSPNIFKSPFTVGSKIRRINSANDKYAYAFVMTSVHPHYYMFGLLMFIIAFLLTGLSWWTFPGAVIFSMGIFWTKWPLILGAIIGIKKYGYKGKYKIMSNNEIIKRIL